MLLRRLLPALLAITACAPPSTLPAAGADAAAAVRAGVSPGQADAVFGRAVRVLRSRGYELVTCDLERGVLRTERAELDAPCFGTTCLVRERVTVKLGWRSVRLAVVREVFDASFRGWAPAADEASRASVDRAETVLLRALLAADLEGAQAGEDGPEGGPCQRAAACGQGQCSTLVQRLDR